MSRFKNPIFKSSRSNSHVEAATMYEQRREMMVATNTLTSGCINHQDRHLGCLIARLYNVSTEECQSLGLWSQSVMEKFYSKYAVVDTVCKMSGFDNSKSFAIDRALPDFDDFRDNHCGSELFDIFMGEIYQPSLQRKAQDMVNQGENTTLNVLKSLKHISRVFWQDLPHYFRQFPSMPIFESVALRSKWDKFMEWCSYVERACASGINQVEDTIGDGASQSCQAHNELDPQTEKTLDETRHLALSNKATLDRILYLMESQDANSRKGSQKRDREKGLEQAQCNYPNKSARLLCTNNMLQSMRKLNGKSVFLDVNTIDPICFRYVS